MKNLENINLVLKAAEHGCEQTAEIRDWIQRNAGVSLSLRTIQRIVKKVLPKKEATPEVRERVTEIADMAMAKIEEPVKTKIPTRKPKIKSVDIVNNGQHAVINLQADMVSDLKSSMIKSNELKDDIYHQYKEGIKVLKREGADPFAKLELCSKVVKALKDADAISHNSRKTILQILVATSELKKHEPEEDKTIQIEIVDAGKEVEL